MIARTPCHVRHWEMLLMQCTPRVLSRLWCHRSPFAGSWSPLSQSVSAAAPDFRDPCGRSCVFVTEPGARRALTGYSTHASRGPGLPNQLRPASECGMSPPSGPYALHHLRYGGAAQLSMQPSAGSVCPTLLRFTSRSTCDDQAQRSWGHSAAMLLLSNADAGP
ncbi:hypothetical protein NDU88_005431 [Pleurodeles waltl]|uniref:Uncharacterized protein n=1 Tax=Pleurodeles waltl TaxID=8319 RepID=A0AAV7RJL8_PLEWA|nr:hypothetical protein NDU88_005431 [Pleurodeles waltl]